MIPDPEDVVRAQVEYYRARAGEYDDWFYRRGRYDRGASQNAAWFADVETARGWVDAWIPPGRVLELAAGTGLWTERLAAKATEVIAVDTSSEVLAVNRARVDAARAAGTGAVAPVEYHHADLFTWSPSQPVDAIFFGFWLSHVPPERFDGFWRMISEWLLPGGRVGFVDSRYEPTSTALDHHLEGEDTTTVLRRLDDGRTFRIVKVFYRAPELMGRLEGLGWKFEVRETERYFLVGTGSPRAGRSSDPGGK